MSNLVIRADGDQNIGTGHVMRCLALAQAWQTTSGPVTFLMATQAPALTARLIAEGMQITQLSTRPGSTDDAQQTIRLAQEREADWVVVDGYHFGTDYQQATKRAGLRLLFVDDYGHANRYCADLVLNQNIDIDEAIYANREPATRLLLGTRYALLRREFWPWRGQLRATSPIARKVLVTLGGADPDNVTLKVIQALQQAETESLEAAFIIGGSNPHIETLQSAIRNQKSEIAKRKIRLERDVANMPELITWADIAISAGGSTCWELAFMGVPSILTMLAPNQYVIAEGLSKVGAAWNLGWHEQVTPTQIAQAVVRLLAASQERAEMARRGQNLVDGDGVDRVLMRMQGQRIRLRLAREGDGQLLWEWANDPSVRAVSFSPSPIPWEQHLKWLRSTLDDPSCVFYIAIHEDETPIGQIRYNVSGDEAIVSVSLEAKFRGKGYSSAVIQLASRKLYQATQVRLIHSYIKVGNETSIKAFLKAGFKEEGTMIMHGQPAVHLILPKEDAA